MLLLVLIITFLINRVDGLSLKFKNPLISKLFFIKSSSARGVTNLFKFNSVDDYNLENTELSYYKSDQYKNLCKYYTAQELEIDESEFSSNKNNFVTKVKDSEKFIPSIYTLESIATIPELFHENILSRGEDHWNLLIELRNLYRRKKSIAKKRRILIGKRLKLSRGYDKLDDEEQLNVRDLGINLRNDLKELDVELSAIHKRVGEILGKLPNILSPILPTDENSIIRASDNLQEYQDRPRKKVFHYDILERLGGKYIGKGPEIAGTGYMVYGGCIPKLNRALVNYMLDTHTGVFGYSEVIVPVVVNESTLKSTGHLPRFEADLFKLDARHQTNGEVGYLIPTAEVPLLAINSSSRVDEKSLPVWLTSCTQCFRSEIQTYGVDTRGLIRLHQFDKVELLCLANPEDSEYYHDLMITHIEFIIKSLELPYRAVLLSSKNTSSSCFKTIDFEVYFPSLDKFVEVSSCSNTRDYQTTKLNLFSRSKGHIHAINGSGLAIGRTISAILENFYFIRENGLLQINVPKVLQPYLDIDVLYEKHEDI